MSSTPLLLIAALTATALAGDATKPDPSSSNESDATKVSNLAKQFGDSSQAAANCNTVAGKKEKCKNLCPDLTLAIKCAVEESGKDFRAADKTSAAGGAAKVELKDALLAKIANSGKQADKDVVDSKEDANKRCDERESKFTGLKKTVDDAADKFQSSASTPAEREAATKVIKDAAADPDKWHIKNRVLKAKRADVVAKQIEKTVAKEGKDSKARVICAKVKIDGSKLDTLRTKAKEINVDSDANTSDFFDVVDAGKGNDDSFDGTSFKPTKPNCRPKPKCVKPIVKPSPNDPTKPVPGGGEKPPAGPSTDPNKPPTGGDKPVVKPPVNAPPPPPSGDQKPPVNSPPSGDQKPPVNPPPSGDQKPPVNPPPSGEQKPPTGDVPKPAPAPVDPPKPSTGDAPKPAPAPVDPPKPPTGDAPKPDPSAPVPAPAPGSDPNKVPAPVPGGFNQVPAPAKPPGQDAGSGAGEKPPADGNSGSGKAPEGSNSGSGGDPAKPGSGSGEKPDGSGSGEKPDGSGSEPGKPGSGEKPDGSGSGEKPDGSGEKPGSGEGHHGDDTTDDEDCQEVPADSKEKGTLKKRHDSHDDEDCNEVSDEDKTEDKTDDKDEDKDEDEEKDEDEKADHDRDPATPSKVPTKRQAAKVSCDVFVPTTAANADLTSVQVAAMLGDLDADVESVDIVGEEDVEIVKAVVVKSPVDSVAGAATQVLAASAVLSAAVARLFW